MRRTDAAVVTPANGMTTAALARRAQQPVTRREALLPPHATRDSAALPRSLRSFLDAVVFATALRTLATDEQQARRLQFAPRLLLSESGDVGADRPRHGVGRQAIEQSRRRSLSRAPGGGHPPGEVHRRRVPLAGRGTLRDLRPWRRTRLL